MATLSHADKFIDVGACIGYFTIPIAKKGHETLAIEALPDNCLLLLKALQRNQIQNAIVLQAAAHDSAKMVRMGGYGAWGQVLRGDEGILVPALTIDEAVEIYNFNDARIIKIDVEGAELTVLHGMTNFLRNNPNAEVIFESNSHCLWEGGSSTKELIRAFEDHGFNVFMFHSNLLVPRTSEDLQEECYVDYLATRRSGGFGDFVVRSLYVEERVRLVLIMANNPLVEYRRHIASALSDAPKEIQSNSRIKTALKNLVKDENEVVREAASWAR